MWAIYSRMDQVQFWKTALILRGPWFDTLSHMQLKKNLT